MPHVELPHSGFAHEALRKKKDLIRNGHGHRFFHKNIATQIAGDHDVDYLNCGTQKVVFLHPDDSSKIVSAEYGNSNYTRFKRNFYLHNILSSLWPHNIPHVFAAGQTVVEKPIAWSIKQRILMDESATNNHNIKYPFSSVKTESDRYGISITHDPHKSNFIVGQDGGEYYVDDLDFWGYLDLNSIDYLATLKNLSSEEKAQITTSIIRFNHLVHKSWGNEIPAIV